MPDNKQLVFMVRHGKPGRGRLIRIPLRKKPELLEARMLLSVSPIQFGAVYVEQDLGSDAHPDTIEISFVGGAQDTQLTRIEIDGDQFTRGLSLSDMIFDTQLGGLGVDLPFDAIVESQRGDFSSEIRVVDGSSTLVMQFAGFRAGDKVTLAVDVDEVQGHELAEHDLELINEELDPIASGAEFQGTRITAYFSAPRFYDAQSTAEFRNRYDEQLQPTSLDLRLDDARQDRDRTAGAVGELPQKPLPISLSGRVYEDHNANLEQDADDPGIANVELALFVEQAGSYVFTGHTTTTDAAGDYAFRESLGLPPGTYRLSETQPDGYFSVGAEVGTVDGVVSGLIENPDIVTSITMPAGGAQAWEYNFAEARPASLRGRVHLSSPEGDCWNASTEYEPVIGATVLLVDALGETVSETKTDADGQYAFADLRPGSYALIELTPEHLFAGGSRAGTVFGESRGLAAESRITEIQLASGDDAVDYDFCDHVPAKLSGSVYHDRNNDGLRAAGEEGIGNAILSLLDEDGGLVDTVETDSEGRYEFVNVRAGNYRVIELQPTGWLDGKDRSGTALGRATGRAINPGDAIEAIQLLWGDEGVDFDFGELKPSSLAGQVHLSTPDGDCWDIDEGLLEPVAGAVVQLLDATGIVLAEAVTDEDGNYFLGDLPPGEYSIRELTPEQLRNGGARAGVVDGSPRGWVSESGDIVGVRLGSDQVGTDYDFCEHKPAVLAGYVYDDSSNDGVRDAGESPIADVVIQLFDEQEKLVAQTVTNAAGRYEFSGLSPGKYAVRQLQPTAFLDGLDSAGTVDGERRGRAINPGDALVEISLGWGETGDEYNFGELRPASLAGSVHAGAGSDCWSNEDAAPLAGVVIRLRGENGRIVAETTTNAMGEYAFGNLAPGEYAVLQEQPNTHFDGGQRAGTSGGDASQMNQISSISLVAGEVATEYDFCERPPGSVSGFVFVDGDPIELSAGEVLPADLSGLRDGRLTEDDVPLSGVVVELRNGITGLAIDASQALPGTYADGAIRAVTNELGFYKFGGLPNGNYAVYEIQPPGYIDGIDTPGTTDGIAINPVPFDEDDIFIETVISSLAVPPANDAIVRIGLPAGVDSRLNNFSEVLTVEIQESPPWVPLTQPPARSLSPAVEPPQPGLYQYARDLAPTPLVHNPIRHEGSAGVKAQSWHLSVIDGGQPRVAQSPVQTDFLFPISLWKSEHLANARWELPGPAGETVTYFFGMPNSVPVAGDFNGDGKTEIAVFLDGHWFIDLNGNGYWDSSDLWAKLGYEGDWPVVGDWDGDGKDDIGIFGRAWSGDSVAIQHEHGLPDMDNVSDGARKNMPPRERESTVGQRVMKHTARGHMRADVIDHVFVYGLPGDIGVVGDWNGDGIDTVGVFRSGIWQLDVDGNGSGTDPDETVQFGEAGDLPLVGDFNGDGIDDLAIIRNGRIYIDANGNRQLDANDLLVEFDQRKGLPIVGKWNGSGADQIGQVNTDHQVHLAEVNAKPVD